MTRGYLHRTWSFGIRSGRHAHAPVGLARAAVATGAWVTLTHNMLLFDTWKCGSISVTFTHPPEDYKKQKTKKCGKKSQYLFQAVCSPPQNASSSTADAHTGGDRRSLRFSLAVLDVKQADAHTRDDISSRRLSFADREPCFFFFRVIGTICSAACLAACGSFCSDPAAAPANVFVLVRVRLCFDTDNRSCDHVCTRTGEFFCF